MSLDLNRSHLVFSSSCYALKVSVIEARKKEGRHEGGRRLGRKGEMESPWIQSFSLLSSFFLFIFPFLTLNGLLISRGSVFSPVCFQCLPVLIFFCLCYLFFSLRVGCVSLGLSISMCFLRLFVCQCSFPQLVDEARAKAKFDKKSKQLVITLPIIPDAATDSSFLSSSPSSASATDQHA